MGCEEMQTWSLSGLVVAFLDLAMAYCFLCASAMAFVASRFLGFFGLSLPCPCDGLFGITNPNPNFCLQKLLIEFPTQKVSRVQLSIRSKFPFGGFSWERDKGSELIVERLIEDRKSGYVNDIVEMEAEASCSSVADGRKPHNIMRLIELSGSNGGDHDAVREGRFDVKGKGVLSQRSRRWLRRRRKGGLTCGKVSSVSSCEPPCEDVLRAPLSTSSSIKNEGDEMLEERKVYLHTRFDPHDSYYGLASRITGPGQRDRILLDEYHKENEQEMNLSSTEILMGKTPREMGSSVADRSPVEILELALKEERASRNALFLELEKERNAAATAADEAMAMILRLQEEKAAFEMEARQYQRIIEEKTVYDEDEMNILKEILIRRETEKLFLEKEVEAYRQMIDLASEELEHDGGTKKLRNERPLDSVPDPVDHPVLILQQPGVNIDKKLLIKDNGKSQCSTDEDPKVQEKEVVSVGDNLNVQPNNAESLETPSPPFESGHFQEHNSSEKTIPIIGEENKQDGTIVEDGTMRNEIETEERVDIDIPINSESLEHQIRDAFPKVKDSCNMEFDKNVQVDDVHVIMDGSNTDNKVRRSQSEQSLVNVTSKCTGETNLPAVVSGQPNLDIILDYPGTSSLNPERDIQRSASNTISSLPPLDPKTRSLHSDRRRNSMSLIEFERSKIDNEVEWLLEKLKIVQDGREKLNLSIEHQGKEKLQLKLLEDISHQLQEIRHLTGPGKAIRQSSLPPPSTEVISKKRRCQSVSSGLQKSS